MKSYDSQPYLMKTSVYLLIGIGACLLMAALWLPKEQEPAGWIPLQTELAAALSAIDDPEMALEPPHRSSVQAQTAVGVVTDGGAAGNAGSAGNAESSGDTGDAGNAESPVNTGNTGIAENTGSADSTAIEIDASQLTEKDGRINLNSASAEQLVTLPGIGPAKAQAIIDFRDKNGPFRSIEDITRVRGIGTKMLEKIKDSIVV